jgi:hypothetical protein
LDRFSGSGQINNAKAVPPADGQSIFLIWLCALVAAVVLTVSVDVCAAVPLIVTEAGFSAQVGTSFTFVIAVLILQFRFTVPLNPFVPSTLIVLVFPVVAPRATVMEVVPPLPLVKPGCAVIVNAILAVALSVPEVPVIVTVNGVVVIAAELSAAKEST